MKEPVLESMLPDSTLTASTRGDREGKEGVTWENTLNVVRMHSQNKVKHLRKQKYEGRWLQE